MNKPKILVVGSMNRDLFVEGANTIPKFGESILCSRYGYATGGKGSNQAFAAARQGAEGVAVGRVGKDSNGDRLLESLESAGVRTEYIPRDENNYTVKCKIVEKNETLFEVSAFAGSRERAIQISDNWKNNANTLYPKIIDILLNGD